MVHFVIVYLSLYELDFLEPLELSPSGCHRFYEGTQGLLSEYFLSQVSIQWALRAYSGHAQDQSRADRNLTIAPYSSS